MTAAALWGSDREDSATRLRLHTNISRRCLKANALERHSQGKETTGLFSKETQRLAEDGCKDGLDTSNGATWVAFVK